METFFLHIFVLLIYRLYTSNIDNNRNFGQYITKLSKKVNETQPIRAMEITLNNLVILLGTIIAKLKIS